MLSKRERASLVSRELVASQSQAPVVGNLINTSGLSSVDKTVAS
jgi:hypothetical protein